MLASRDYSQSGFPLRDCSRCGFPLRDCTRRGFPLRDCSRCGSRLRDYARRGFRLSDRARCRALGRRHTRTALRGRCSLCARLGQSARLGWLSYLCLACCCCAENSLVVPEPPRATLGARKGLSKVPVAARMAAPKQRQAYIVGHCWPL